MSEVKVGVVGFEEALAEVMQRAIALRAGRQPLVSEAVPLLASAGRILARAVCADRDQPPFDRATRDGFAVRAEEFSAGGTLRIVGQVKAGMAWSGPAMASGEAIEIMTGAPLPAGADAVAMIEHVDLSGAAMRAASARALREGENIVLRGSEAAVGVEVISTGTVVGAAEIAIAATCGLSALQVFTRPRVAIVATGDELVELDAIPGPHQIRNSNSYALAALVEAAGGTAERLPIAPDRRDDLLQRIAEGRVYDLMLLSGGVSMGKFDLVEEVLAQFGAEFFFTGVSMQPGKPVVFGRLPPGDAGNECFFFGLPGNPVSTQVTFHCFVEPFLRTICDERNAAPRFVQATLLEDVAGKPGLTRILPAHITHDLRQPSVRLVGWQGSGDLAANARANCYAVLSPEKEQFRAGDVISVLLR